MRRQRVYRKSQHYKNLIPETLKVVTEKINGLIQIIHSHYLNWKNLIRKMKKTVSCNLLQDQAIDYQI